MIDIIVSECRPVLLFLSMELMKILSRTWKCHGHENFLDSRDKFVRSCKHQRWSKFGSRAFPQRLFSRHAVFRETLSRRLFLSTKHFPDISADELFHEQTSPRTGISPTASVIHRCLHQNIGIILINSVLGYKRFPRRIPPMQKVS